MATVCARIRLVVAAIAFLVFAAVAAPVAAQQPNSVNPNADAVKEQQLLQQLNRIQGRGTIPDTKSYVIEQPHGPRVAAVPRGVAALDRRHRDPRHDRACCSFSI